MKRMAALFAFALIVTACGDTTGGTGVDGGTGGTGDGIVGSPQEGLDRPWILVTGTVEGQEIAVPDGHRITLTVTGDQVGGSAACNSYGGTASIDGSQITFGEIVRTLIGCEPPVMTAEEAYLVGLAAVDRFELGPQTLVLTGPDTVLNFEPLPAVPTADLVGTEWLLESLVDGDVVSSVSGDPATLLLGADGSLAGSTGCRTLTGRYVVSGDEVNATELAADGDCPADLATQDGHVIEVLGDGFTAAVDGDRLELASVGNKGLIYRSR